MVLDSGFYWDIKDLQNLVARIMLIYCIINHINADMDLVACVWLSGMGYYLLGISSIPF